MQLKGKLITWNTEKAYGFIAPNGGGDRVFIHKSAFSNRNRVPQVNDLITFFLTRDQQGRYCAEKANYSGETFKPTQAQSASNFSITFACIFIGLLLIALVVGYIPKGIVFFYLGASAFTYIVYVFDKSKAQRGVWRTPESTLHILALVGGWPGAAIAQQIHRHKSKKRKFRSVFWLTVIVNCSTLAWLFTSNGESFLAAFS